MSQSDHSCLIRAWRQHSGELRGWLLKRVDDMAEVDDLLQTVFFKALLQKEKFCSIKNARAWLFRVTRNSLIDSYRMQRNQVDLPYDLSRDEPELDAVEELSACLPRVLSELSAEDREVITLCDLDGMSQQHFADLNGIGLPAVKSRIQRAHRRLHQTLEANCQVRMNNAGNVCCFVPRSPVK